jgi:hypothetical protein
MSSLSLHPVSAMSDNDSPITKVSTFIVSVPFVFKKTYCVSSANSTTLSKTRTMTFYAKMFTLAANFATSTDRYGSVNGLRPE